MEKIELSRSGLRKEKKDIDKIWLYKQWMEIYIIS